jgi:tetratricopeptide (TPR) repeat protein
MLKDQRELRPEKVKQEDLLEGWLSSHQQSSSDRATRARARVAADRHNELCLNLAIGIFNWALETIPSPAVADSFALRGFVRHLTGDERGAKQDRESCLGAARKVNIQEWDVALGQAKFSSKKLLGGAFLTWLQPDYPNGHRYQAEANCELKQYEVALTEVNEAIKLQPTNDAARGSGEAVTPAMASLLLLRGRLLEAQHSPEGRKDFQQVVDGLAAAGIVDETKAFAQLHLGKFDRKYFTEAERLFKDQTTKSPDRSLTYYNLACFFAARSASPGRDKNARAKDVTAAIDALRTGVNLPEHDSLRRFVDTTAELLPLKNDPRLTELLKEEEASASGDSE